MITAKQAARQVMSLQENFFSLQEVKDLMAHVETCVEIAIREKSILATIVTPKSPAVVRVVIMQLVDLDYHVETIMESDEAPHRTFAVSWGHFM